VNGGGKGDLRQSKSAAGAVLTGGQRENREGWRKMWWEEDNEERDGDTSAGPPCKKAVHTMPFIA
jgi:hypothetical protein